ncbi:MAG: polyprenyl synthetase family protein [Anaerolineae bacterium CFX3]|nr:polyprenyl synthetase family protein [Anaerolineales bacterium]MCE7904899.1 polyprenyl synthetase family protein [Anaerolineae bacterium CFX3]MCQ3945737.1 polyprenyl synthetase family protein [Anaerolineae bacterium]MCZ2290005.1 polyprenyl synthetase family protein [Anaerolineales bacterium]RIK27213.1 MAG: polyprenyl synthetase [Anaerolineae bacterium]
MLPNLLSAIETELQKQVARLDEPRTRPFHEMLAYHMGWTGEGAGPEATGKRVRPLLVLLAAASCGADWRPALPAAAAVELVHNFSLLHDDIEDNSDKRRGRTTVWKKWGLAQGINAGDGMFILANLALADLEADYPAPIVIRAATILQHACLDLTRGQFLDISYEDRADLAVDDYWPMVGGKTAALIAACCQLGALLGGADAARQEAYRAFGHYLGLAFQVQDDILGIWGDEALTGKSAAGDLVEGKKSLPVLFGLEKNGEFARRWQRGPIRAEEVRAAAALLEAESARRSAQEAARQMTDLALESLRVANPQGEAGEALKSLADKLLQRGA